jgi:hypothetical protein
VPLVRAGALDTTAPEWLVEGIIPITGTGFIWGESRWGKSLLVNGELALAIANGTEFFGRPTVQGSVAICLGEGVYDAGLRKQARLALEQSERLAVKTGLEEQFGEESAQEWLDSQPPYTDDNLFFLTEPFALPLDNKGVPTHGLTTALDSMRQIQNLSLIILDSLGDFTPGLAITNDASANRAVQGMKLLARELEAVVLAVAHPVRDGSRMLGAGRLFNSADFVMKVEPDSGSTQYTDVRSATVYCEKNKYGKPFEPFSYFINPVSWMDEDGGLIQTATIMSNVEYDDVEQVTQEPKPIPTLLRN